MPDARLQRTRAAYNGHDWEAERRLRNMRHELSFYEKAYEDVRLRIGDTIRVKLPTPNPWRAPHENAAEQLTRQAEPLSLMTLPLTGPGADYRKIVETP